MADESEDKIQIILPKDPIQIGTANDGQPIWIDPKDLILTPDLKLEQRANMDRSEAEKALHNARLSLAARVETWLALTITQIVPENIASNREQTEAWVKDKDINYIEDSTAEGKHRFVLRMGQKVISEFVATIKPVT